jgi:hypothetical protein
LVGAGAKVTDGPLGALDPPSLLHPASARPAVRTTAPTSARRPITASPTGPDPPAPR